MFCFCLNFRISLGSRQSSTTSSGQTSHRASNLWAAANLKTQSTLHFLVHRGGPPHCNKKKVIDLSLKPELREEMKRVMKDDAGDMEVDDEPEPDRPVGGWAGVPTSS